MVGVWAGGGGSHLDECDNNNNDSDDDDDDGHLDCRHFHVGGHRLPTLLGHVTGQVGIILEINQCQYKIFWVSVIIKLKRSK